MEQAVNLRPGSFRGSVTLAVFASCFALYLYRFGINYQYVWIDEFLTSRAVQMPWLGLIEDRIAAGHFPTYWLLVKSLGISADDYAAMRLVSAVFMACAVGVLSGGVYLFLDFRAGILTALFLAVAPDFAFWAQQARPYGLSMLGVSVSLVATIAIFARIERDEEALGVPGFWLNFGLVMAAVSLTTTLLAAILLAVTPVFAFGRVGRWRAIGLWFRGLLPFGIVLAIALILVTVPTVIDLSTGFWVEENHPMGLRALASLAQNFHFAPATTQTAAALGLSELSFRILFWPVAAILLGLACYAIVSLRRQLAVLPIIVLAVAYPAILLGVSIHSSLLLDRYFLPVLGPYLALSALGVAVFSDRISKFLALTVGVLVASMLAAATFGVLRSPNDHLQTDYSVLERRIASFGVGPESVFLDEHWQGQALREALIHNTSLQARAYEGLQSGMDRLTMQIADGAPALLLFARPRRTPVLEGLPENPICIEEFGFYLLAVFGPVEDIACMTGSPGD